MPGKHNYRRAPGICANYGDPRARPVDVEACLIHPLAALSRIYDDSRGPEPELPARTTVRPPEARTEAPRGVWLPWDEARLRCDPACPEALFTRRARVEVLMTLRRDHSGQRLTPSLAFTMAA